MSELVQKIANRHIARCLSKIEQVHKLPEICADVIKREMHYCADDVLEAETKHGDNNNDDIGNR